MAQIVSEFQATHVAAFGSTGTKNILQFHLQKFIYKCAIALAWRMQRGGKGKGRTWGLGVKGSNSGSRNQEAERGSGLRKTNGIKEENQILLECHWQQPTATTRNDSNNNKRQQPTTTTTTRGRRTFSGCRVRKHADGPSKVLAVTREW